MDRYGRFYNGALFLTKHTPPNNMPIHSGWCVCHFEGPLDWATNAAVHTEYGMRMAGKNMIRFPNFIRSALIWRLVRGLSNNDELGRMAYISFLFAIRLPSGTLSIRRDHKGGKVTLFTPPTGEGVDRL